MLVCWQPETTGFSISRAAIVFFFFIFFSSFSSLQNSFKSRKAYFYWLNTWTHFAIIFEVWFFKRLFSTNFEWIFKFQIISCWKWWRYFLNHQWNFSIPLPFFFETGSSTVAQGGLNLWQSFCLSQPGVSPKPKFTFSQLFSPFPILLWSLKDHVCSL